MKQLLVAFMLLISGHIFCQDRSYERIESLREKAWEMEDDSAFKKAISIYEKIARKYDKNSAEYANAIHCIARNYRNMGDHQMAIKYYEQLLKSNSGRSYPNKKLKAEANGRESRIWMELAETEISLGSFDKALSCLKKSEVNLSAGYSCGNAVAEAEQRVAMLYLKAFVGIRDTTSAIQKILPQMFYNGLVRNEELVDYVLPLIKAKYNSTYLIAQLDRAAENVVKGTGKNIAWSDNYITTLLGVVISVPECMGSLSFNADCGNGSPLESRKDAIRKSYFYSLLKQ